VQGVTWPWRYRHLLRFLLTALIGVCMEVCFTSIMTLLAQIQAGDWSLQLKGWSYPWMLPIYGLAGVAFPWVRQYIGGWPRLAQVLFLGVGILVVEFLSGWLLDVTTGQCPWEYTTGWHILGYIRLDYYPAWCAFAYGVMRLLEAFDVLLSPFRVLQMPKGGA
jgi:uncharacterized membrane protein